MNRPCISDDVLPFIVHKLDPLTGSGPCPVDPEYMVHSLQIFLEPFQDVLWDIPLKKGGMDMTIPTRGHILPDQSKGDP